VGYRDDLRYIGKGQKVNHVPIHPVAGYHLGQYLDRMASKGRPIGPGDYLFQASKQNQNVSVDHKLSHTALGYIVKKWARQVNLAKRITPHSARATFISSLLENGEDIYSVAQAVNHADVRTTARYDKRKIWNPLKPRTTQRLLLAVTWKYRSFSIRYRYDFSTKNFKTDNISH
jgi:site-specific recombinase XerD